MPQPSESRELERALALARCRLLNAKHELSTADYLELLQAVYDHCDRELFTRYQDSANGEALAPADL